MRNVRIASCFALVAVVLLTTPASFAAAPQGPRIYIAEPRSDLGSVVEGTVAEHVFEIKNVGDEPLIIERLQPT